MPIKTCILPGGGTGFKWGDHGHCYPTRAQAEKQAAAAHAHGYVGDQKPKLVSPTGKDIKLKPVRPNVGIGLAYRRKLRALVAEMNASVDYWIKAKYKANLNSIVQDSAANDLQDEFNRLSKQWLKKFDDGAVALATWFTNKTKDNAENSLKRILRDAGFSVEFKMTPSMRNAYQAVLNENVALIRNIPEQYLTQLQGDVMRSVSLGRDLEQLNNALIQRYQIADRRAKLISRDQNNKATAIITKQRQLDLGLTQAIWRHSTAGKHPRPEHVAADGKRYDVTKGMYLDGEWTWPGVEINCRCISVPVIPGYNE